MIVNTAPDQRPAGLRTKSKSARSHPIGQSLNPYVCVGQFYVSEQGSVSNKGESRKP